MSGRSSVYIKVDTRYSIVKKRTDGNFELGRILKTLRIFNEAAYLEDRLGMYTLMALS